MKKIGFLFLSILGLWLFYTGTVSATTYYIDASSGNDNSNGTSEATARKSLTKPQDILQPGDVVLLKRGSVFPSNERINTAKLFGTIDQPIIYDAYGEGEAPIVGSGNAYAIYGVTGTHIEFHNLHLRNSTNSAINLTVPHIKFFTININTGGGFVAQDNWKIEGLIMDNANTIYIRGYNIQLRNVYISNSKGGGIVIGYSAIVADNISLDTVVVSGCAEKLTGDTSVGLGIGNPLGTGTVSNIIVKNSRFQGCYQGLIITSNGGASNITVSDSEISYAREGRNMAGTSVIGNGIHIGNNRNHLVFSGITANNNTGNGIMINGSGNDLLIINSEFNRNTNNGVFFAASPIEIDAIVKNSTANDNLSDGFNVHGGKKIIFEECNAERNGNREVTSQGSDGDGYTFHGDSSGIIRYSSAKNNKKAAIAHIGQAQVEMYYNVFSHDTNGQIALVWLTNSGVYTIYNNVLYSAGGTGLGLMIADVLTATVKNNIIQGFAKGIKVDTGVALTEDYNIFYNTNDDIGFTLGNHSLTGVDPQFVNTINGDFTLQATSPAINRGSAVALTRDFSGTTVPLYASVDIGAFERIDTIPPIATYTPTSGTTTIGPVEISLTLSEAVQTLVGRVGNAGMTGFTKSFSSNRSGNIEFVDLAGNTGQTFVDIYWIASSTCTNGAINYPTCNNQTPSNGGSSISGGGSGGGSLSKDTCPTGDFSASYYDKTCGSSADLAEEVAKKVNVLRPLIVRIFLTATEAQKTFVHNLITSCSQTNKKEIIKLACQELVEKWDF